MTPQHLMVIVPQLRSFGGSQTSEDVSPVGSQHSLSACSLRAMAAGVGAVAEDDTATVEET